MSIKNKVADNTTDFHKNNENEAAIEKKLDELIEFIALSDIDRETVEIHLVRFNNAVKLSLDPLGALISGDKSTNDTVVDDFSILLSNKRYQVKFLKKFLYSGGLARVVLLLISVVLIVLGYGMIIMPAPPFFEMFTIFYFNTNDGITIMDCISLLVILSGVYFLIKAVFSKPILLRKTKF